MIEITDEAWNKLWSHTDTTNPEACWAWDGTVSGGTPMVFLSRPGTKGVNASARRVIWDQLHPDEPLRPDEVVTVDCDERSCVNPAHFVRLTRKEFALRTGSATSVNARRTHCKHGHELTEENVYRRKDGRGRQCKQCAREQVQKHRAKRKASEPPAPPAP